MKRSVSILGSTGSIGTQALEVCEVHGIEVKALAAKRNEELLEKQVAAALHYLNENHVYTEVIADGSI